MKRCSPTKIALTLLTATLFAEPAPAQTRPAAKSAAKKSQPAAHTPLDAARAQLAKSDLEGAEHTLWQVLNADANNHEALALLAVVRGRQQRYAEAESLFRRVVELDPKSPTAHVNLAGALVAEDKFDEAIGEYKQAQVLAPQNYAVRLELARLQSAQGQYGEALANLESVPKASLPLAALPLKAGCLLALGRIPEALALAPLVKASPTVSLDMAEVFVRSSLAAPALKSLADAAPGLKPVPARFYYLKGKALLQKEQTAAAMENFEKALALDPKDSGTLIVMAEIYASQRKHEQSFAMLERAHAVDPDAVPVMRHLIVEGVEAGKKQAVLAAAAALVEKSPDNAEGSSTLPAQPSCRRGTPWARAPLSRNT